MRLHPMALCISAEPSSAGWAVAEGHLEKEYSGPRSDTWGLPGRLFHYTAEKPLGSVDLNRPIFPWG